MTNRLSETAGGLVQSIHSKYYKMMIDDLVLARKTAEMTQEEVAAVWGRKQSILAKIETCERRIDLIEFIILSRIVKMDPVGVVEKIRTMIAKKHDR